MKKNIGAQLALYPAPVIVVGAIVNDKPTWTLVAHAGTMAHSHLMVSLVHAHYINQEIIESKKLSVNIVDEAWLKEADRMGVISGNKEDKSESFAYTIGENGALLIDDAKVSIECEVDGNYELEKEQVAVTYENGTAVPVPELITDTKGYAVSPELPYGSYVVVESTTPENLKTIDPLDTNTYGQTKGRSGSYSVNYQQTGRELLTPDEIRLLDNRKAILFIRGERPIMDDKYDLKKHVNFRYTEDGGASPYDYAKTPLAHDDLKIDINRLDDYELLSTEDILGE